MLAVEVELLAGRYVATRFNDRDHGEWPPHPARLFSAAVAAWADADEPAGDERAALLWWETLGPPHISCSWQDPEGRPQWRERASVTHYVPDNDVSVFARDLSKVYEQLQAANARLQSLSQGTDVKALAKAERDLAKVVAKAAADSAKVSSGGRVPEAARGLLPDERGRQGRTYPTVVPDDPRVVYVWADADASSPHVAVLDKLLSRIGRLGHSSSPVSVRVVDDAPPATLAPDDRGSVGLRVASSGQLRALERAFAAHEGREPRTLPALVQPYAEAEAAKPLRPRPHFDRNWVLLELNKSSRFDVRDTLALARGVRGALMRHSLVQPAPEIISGHVPSPGQGATAATHRNHVAIVPLPFAAFPHADGHVLGVALILPDSAEPDERATVVASAARWLDEHGGQLRLGSGGVATLSRVPESEAAQSMHPRRWCRASRVWLTVTPIALDRHPGSLNDRDPAKRDAAEQAARKTIAQACEHIGLPTPVDVQIGTDPLVAGSFPIRRFPAYTVQGGRVRRCLVHAAIDFGQQVEGPVILGAGRFYGYGLCAPASPQPRGGDNSD
ncbi:MAG TPA: type I-U CRISPR-associated protein Csb2 [Acidimicrobiales bacterium]